MAKASTAVVRKEEGGAVVAIPDFMKDQAGLGTEALGSGDVEVPRIKLMQKISPELEVNNDLRAGDFFHTLADLNLGSEVRITPIYVDQGFILWRPQETGGGILARADDGIHWSPSGVDFNVKLKTGQEVVWRTASTVAASGLAAWGSSNPADPNSPPAATRMYKLVVTLPDHPDLPPAVVTLQRSAIRVARKFIGKLKITRAPSFGLIFKMKSTSDTNNAGQPFLNYSFVADGMVQDKDTYDNNFSMYEYFKKQGVQVRDLEDAQSDGLPSEAAEEGAGKPGF